MNWTFHRYIGKKTNTVVCLFTSARSEEKLLAQVYSAQWLLVASLTSIIIGKSRLFLEKLHFFLKQLRYFSAIEYVDKLVMLKLLVSWLPTLCRCRNKSSRQLLLHFMINCVICTRVVVHVALIKSPKISSTVSLGSP